LDWKPPGHPKHQTGAAFNTTAQKRMTEGQKVSLYSDPRRNGGKGAHLTSQAGNLRRLDDGLKFGGGWWHDSTNNLIRKASSKSSARKQASAEIAKIPFPLAQWIAQVFKAVPNALAEIA
jgi:hypothetical protein